MGWHFHGEATELWVYSMGSLRNWPHKWEFLWLGISEMRWIGVKNPGWQGNQFPTEQCGVDQWWLMVDWYGVIMGLWHLQRLRDSPPYKNRWPGSYHLQRLKGWLSGPLWWIELLAFDPFCWWLQASLATQMGVLNFFSFFIRSTKRSRMTHVACCCRIFHLIHLLS